VSKLGEHRNNWAHQQALSSDDADHRHTLPGVGAGPPSGGPLRIGHLWHRKTRLTLTRSAVRRTTLSRKERQNNEWGCGSNSCFVPYRTHYTGV
jgi:hypothetical protein